jgi:hypothetical protein
MSKFVCTCNHVMSLASWSENHEMLLVHESTIEEISSNLDNMNYDKFDDILYRNSLSVLKCPKCKRIWVSSEEGVNQSPYISYIPE